MFAGRVTDLWSMCTTLKGLVIREWGENWLSRWTRELIAGDHGMNHQRASVLAYDIQFE